MDNKIDHVYWFAASGLTCPSTRYRGLYPLQKMKQEGISYDFIYPEKSIKQVLLFASIYFKVLLFRKKKSIIVIQKIYTNRFYANVLKLLITIRKKNTVYDIDDAEQYRRSTDTVVFFLRKCAYISAGSHFLMNYCQQFNKNVFIQTSPVDLPENSKIHPKKNDKLHIGWVGDFGNGNQISKPFSHKESLYKLLFPNVLQLEYPIKLTLIGVKNSEDIPKIYEYFRTCQHVELNIPTELTWEKDTWLYDEIGNFDVGISLMIDHPFNQAKSAFKAKQYLVCGVPVLANDVGETRNFIFDKINGFICNNDNEIIMTLNKIHHMNYMEFNKLSENCRKSIDEFSVNRYCANLLNHIEN